MLPRQRKFDHPEELSNVMKTVWDWSGLDGGRHQEKHPVAEAMNERCFPPLRGVRLRTEIYKT